MPWDLTGNSGTSPANNFLGTTDDQPLVIRTNGTEALRVDGSGSVVIGDSTGIEASLGFSPRRVSVLEFGQGPSSLLFLRRDESQEAEGEFLSPAQNVSFILDPTNRVFNLDVSGQHNGAARIHLGDPADPDNPVTTLGNVGIGTMAPQQKLHVDGDVLVTGDITLSGADCAEDFDVEESQALDPGTVMVIGDEEKLHQCTKAHDKRVAGVLSGAGNSQPAIILGRRSSRYGRLPLALTGKAYCKVDSQYAPIDIGDLLTTSPTPGHAMKASDPLRASGAILGKALRPLRQGEGLIPILIALQ